MLVDSVPRLRELQRDRIGRRFRGVATTQCICEPQVIMIGLRHQEGLDYRQSSDDRQRFYLVNHSDTAHNMARDLLNQANISAVRHHVASL